MGSESSSRMPGGWREPNPAARAVAGQASASLVMPGRAAIPVRVLNSEGPALEVAVDSRPTGLPLRRRVDLVLRLNKLSLPTILPGKIVERQDTEGDEVYRIELLTLTRPDSGWNPHPSLPFDRGTGACLTGNREGYRVKPHVAKPIRVEIADPQGGASLEARLADLSHDGLGVLLKGDDEGRLAGVREATASIHLGNGKPLSVEIGIRRRYVAGTNCWLGCVVFDEPEELSAFVLARQREMLQAREE